MKTNKKLQVKKLSVLAIAGLGVLVPTVMVGCGGKPAPSNDLTFNNGIVVTYGDSMKTLTNYTADKSATFLVSGEDVFGSNIQPGQSYNIKNPTLKPKKGTKNYFLRAKLAYYGISSTANSENDAVNITNQVDEIFTVKPEFSSSWLESADGYYYNVNSGVTSWNDNGNMVNLKVNYSNGEDVLLFGSNSNSYTVASGARINYDIIAVNVVVEAVNSDNQTEAGLANLGWSMQNNLITGLTLNFDTDGGSNVNSLVDVTEGDRISLNSSQFATTKPGYNFEGWMLNNQVVQSVTFGKDDVSLKAKWSPIRYNVKYFIDGNEQEDSNTYRIGDTITLDTAEKPGYRLEGWNFGGQLYQAGSFVLDANKIANADQTNTLNFTAEFKAIDYKLFYDLNGGEGVIVDENKYHIGDSTEITDVVPVKDGYDFLGWSDGQSVYMSNSLISFQDEDINLVAQWQKSQYSLTYDLDGGVYEGSEDLNPVELYTIDDNSVALIDFASGDEPTKPGYTFAGWTLTKGDQTSVEVVNYATELRNVTVYAKWNLVNYKLYRDYGTTDPVTYQGNQVSGQVELAGDHYHIEDSAYLDTPERDGYVFVGWYLNDQKVEDYIVFGVSDVTVVAHWAEKVTVDFYLNSQKLEDKTIVGYNGLTSTAPNSITIADTTVSNGALVGWMLNNNPSDLLLPNQQFTLNSGDQSYYAKIISTSFGPGEVAQNYIIHPVVLKNDSTIILPECLYQSSSKHFIGWKKLEDETLYNVGDEVDALGFNFSAVWDNCVHFDSNGGRIINKSTNLDISENPIWFKADPGNQIYGNLTLNLDDYQITPPEGKALIGVEATSGNEVLETYTDFLGTISINRYSGNFEEDVYVKFIWGEIEDCPVTFEFIDPNERYDEEQSLKLTNKATGDEIYLTQDNPIAPVTYDCVLNESGNYLTNLELFDGYEVELTKSYSYSNPIFTVYSKTGEKIFDGMRFSALANAGITCLPGGVKIVVSWEYTYELRIVPGEGAQIVEGAENIQNGAYVTDFSTHYHPEFYFLPFVKEGYVITGFKYVGEIYDSFENNWVEVEKTDLSGFFCPVTATPIWTPIKFNAGSVNSVEAQAYGTPVLRINSGKITLPDDGELLDLRFAEPEYSDYVIAKFETKFNGKTKVWGGIDSQEFADGVWDIGVGNKIYYENGKYYFNDEEITDIEENVKLIVKGDNYVSESNGVTKLVKDGVIYIIDFESNLYVNVEEKYEQHTFSDQLSSQDGNVTIGEENTQAKIYALSDESKIYYVGGNYYFVPKDSTFNYENSEILICEYRVDYAQYSYGVLKHSNNDNVVCYIDYSGNFCETINEYNTGNRIYVKQGASSVAKSFDGLEITAIWGTIPEVPADESEVVIAPEEFDQTIEFLSKAYNEAFTQTINNNIMATSYIMNGDSSNPVSVVDVSELMFNGVLLHPTLFQLYAEQENATVNAKYIPGVDGSKTYYMYGGVNQYVTIFIMKLDSNNKLVEYGLRRYDGLVREFTIEIVGGIEDPEYPENPTVAQAEEVETLVEKFNNAIMANLSDVSKIYLATIDVSKMTDDVPEGFTMTMAMDDGSFLGAEIITPEIAEGLSDVEITYNEVEGFAEYHFTAQIRMAPDADPIEIKRIYKFNGDALVKYYTNLSIAGFGEVTIAIL